MIITQEQERLLTTVGAEKKNYDLQVEEAKRQFEATKRVLKRRVWVAVKQAEAGGVPKRQIHQKGLGFAQATQQMQFFYDVAYGDVLVPLTDLEETVVIPDGKVWIKGPSDRYGNATWERGDDKIEVSGYRIVGNYDRTLVESLQAQQEEVEYLG